MIKGKSACGYSDYTLKVEIKQGYKMENSLSSTLNNENILNEIIKNIKRIKTFETNFNTLMGQCKKNETNISVFYEEDILEQFKEKGTYLKNENGIFYIYTGTFWKSLDDEVFERFIKQYIKKRGEVSHRSHQIVKGVFKNISITYGGIVVNRQSNTQYLNLQNGVIAISKDSIDFLPHNKNYHLNYMLDFNYTEEKENNLWLKFLDEVLPDKETQKTLQQVIGSLLMRGHKIEILPFLYGTGGNGKSVVLEVLEGLFGHENITTFSLTGITTSDQIRAEMSDGKLMNLASENNMANVNVETLKAYSSGESLTARRLFGKPFNLRDYSRFLGNINKLSVVDGERTRAVARRFIIIPFLQQIKSDKMDIRLHNKILKNKSGVLNWILDGIRDVLANIESTNQNPIYKSKEVTDLLHRYEEDTNPVQQLLHERDYKILPTAPRSEWISLQSLYADYKDFVESIGAGRLNRNNFKTDLMAIDGVKIEKSHNKDHVNLSNEYEPTQPPKVEYIDEKGKVYKTEPLPLGVQ